MPDQPAPRNVIVLLDWGWSEGPGERRWLPTPIGVVDKHRDALDAVLARVQQWNAAAPSEERLILPTEPVAAIKLYQRVTGRRIQFVRTRYYPSPESSSKDTRSINDFDDAPGETITDIPLSLAARRSHPLT